MQGVGKKTCFLKKSSKAVQGPGSSGPPWAVPPNLPSRARHLPPYLPASRLLLPALLRLFLLLSFLLLSPSPCCLGLFMEIHSFMPSHRSLSLSLPPGGRACDASPLSSHFLLSESGAAPARSGGRAGTRVGSAGPGERPQRGARGVGTAPTRPGATDRPWHPQQGGRLGPRALRSPHPHAKALPPIAAGPHQRGHGWARTSGRSPGNPRPFFSLSARLSILFLLVFPPPLPLPPHRARSASRPAGRCPIPAGAEALTQARSGAAWGARAPRPVPWPSHPTFPTPGAARPSGSSGKLHLCSSFPRTGVPPLPSAALRGAGDTLPSLPTALATAPRCPGTAGGLGECEPRTVSGSTAGPAAGGF